MKEMTSDAREVLVDLAKTRSPEQLEEYERIQEAGICPFCPEHRSDYAEGEEVSSSEDWWLFENNWPYKNTKRHVVAVSQKHATYLEEIDLGAASDLFRQLRAIEADEQYEVASINARFGFVLWTGASVAHFHAHMIVPDGGDDSLVESHEFGDEAWSGAHWTVYENKRPHELAREHLLVVTNQDAEFLSDIPPEADAELLSHLQRIESEYEFSHGGLHSRVGKRKQAGDAVGKIVVEMIAPLDEVADNPEKKLRVVVSESPPVQFKIST